MPEQESDHVYFGFADGDWDDDIEEAEVCPRCGFPLDFGSDPEFAYCARCENWLDKSDL